MLRHTSGALLLVLCACGTPTVSSSSASPAASQRAVNAPPDAGLPVTAVKAADFGENEFTESDRNRDPFRSYASLFVEQGKKPTVSQRTVVLGQYSIDELKLVAIVTGGEYPRAMLVDPTTKGWIVKRGDFIGRPDVVHTGGTNGTDYQLNWRVDRVRDGDVVLIREDPAQPGVPPATRVIPLHNENENGPTSQIN
jgi:type IV pilus assembly protein PilP